MDDESEKNYVQRLESLEISRLTGTINLNDENILKYYYLKISSGNCKIIFKYKLYFNKRYVFYIESD